MMSLILETTSEFLGVKLGEKLGFSREGCMLLGIVASIAGGYGAEKVHVNYDDLVSTFKYTVKNPSDKVVLGTGMGTIQEGLSKFNKNFNDIKVGKIV